MTPEALPGLDWLRHLPADPVTATREFVAAWYADVPPGDLPTGPTRPVPPALRAFYEAAAGRPMIHEGQNRIHPADELRESPDGRLWFAAENQGVAALASPYGGWSTDDAPPHTLHPVPLRPMRVPADPTRLLVAPGVVGLAATTDDGTEVFLGSRWPSALRPFRDAGWGT
jgi:hypothetical protein